MKSIWYPILASALLFSCENVNNNKFSEGNLIVNFEIEELEGKEVVLELLTSNPKHIQLDTVNAENGKGFFKYETEKTSFYQVYVPGENGEIIFIANPGDTIEIEANAKKIYSSSKIGGTRENIRLDSLITLIKATKFYTDSLQMVYKQAESKQMHYALLEHFQKLYGNAKMKEEAFVINFIRKNPGQYSNLLAVNSLNKLRHREIFQLVDSALVKNFPTNEDVLKFHESIEKRYPPSVGKKAPNFTLLDQNEKNISLSDFEGKYVLLDFWATWCGPCIKEIPNLKRIHENFGGDRFEVISVCHDRNNPDSKRAWKRINEQHGTTWTQVYDAGGLATAKNYKITHYPTMLVLGPDGKIIDAGNHIRGENAYQIIKNLVENE